MPDEEYFDGVIGAGNQPAHPVDENDKRECVIKSADSMARGYRHIGHDRTVVTRET